MVDLKFIDSNCYVGKMAVPGPLGFDSVSALLEDMDYYQIEQAVVTHAEARDFSADVGNHALLPQLAGCDRLIPCWVLPAHPVPEAPAAKSGVEQMLAAGVRVARMFPPRRAAYSLEFWARSDYFAALEDHRIPLLITGSDLGRHPDDTTFGLSADNIYAICQAHPRLPIIVVRFNYTFTQIVFPMLRDCPNLHLEISYYTTHRGLELITRDFGPERLIFGTGTPVGNPGLPLMRVRYANISDDERALIAGGNMRRLLNEVR